LNALICSEPKVFLFVVLEYASDLEDYYERGFNPPISYEWTCRHVKEITGALKNASEKSMKNESHMFGHFDFGHSDNVMSLAANLKLIHPVSTRCDMVICKL